MARTESARNASFDLPITIERRVIVAEIGDDGLLVTPETPLETAGVVVMREIANYLASTASDKPYDTLIFEYGGHEFTISAAPLRQSDDVRDRLGAH